MAKKSFYFFLLLLLPAIFLFDLLAFLTTKVTCLSCDMSDFFRNSSLTVSVVNQVWANLHKKVL